MGWDVVRVGFVERSFVSRVCRKEVRRFFVVVFGGEVVDMLVILFFFSFSFVGRLKRRLR